MENTSILKHGLKWYMIKKKKNIYIYIEHLLILFYFKCVINASKSIDNVLNIKRSIAE